MAPTTNGSISSQFEQQQREVVNTFARAAIAMRDAARVAEEFSNWFARVNDMKSIPPPPSSSFGSAPSPPFDAPAGSKKRKAGKEASPPLVDENGKKKRVVKEKKARDKDAPKRPASAYLLFQNEVRKDVKNEHPNMNNQELLNEVSRLWSAVSEKEKEMYVERHEALKSKYDKEKAEYDAKHGIVQEEKKDGRSKKSAKKPTPLKEDTSNASRTKRAASDDSEPVSPPEEEEDEPEPEEAELEAQMTEEEEEEGEEEGKGAGDSDVESEQETEPEPPKKKTKVDDDQSSSRKNLSAVKEKEKDKKSKPTRGKK